MQVVEHSEDFSTKTARSRCLVEYTFVCKGCTSLIVRTGSPQLSTTKIVHTHRDMYEPSIPKPHHSSPRYAKHEKKKGRNDLVKTKKQPLEKVLNSLLPSRIAQLVERNTK